MTHQVTLVSLVVLFCFESQLFFFIFLQQVPQEVNVQQHGLEATCSGEVAGPSTTSQLTLTGELATLGYVFVVVILTK